ncbi:MAG: TetR/AcrR family transcriptional regulator C-terminal domain-containing protein [Bacillota bacterium]|nr:TetR/AcrR family transcriptional regulator C-terminal domain-containing protein [Bacillota bacterium]
MAGEKIDRRVKYTKMVLEESLITLMEKKDISKITIKEICEKADINRSTFYAHYRDQYDLLRKIENKFLAAIQAYLENFDKKYTEDIVLITEKIFQYIRKNARICRLLLSERGDFTFQKKIMKLVYDLIISEITGNNKITKEDAEYVYSFTVSGCVGFVQKWLDDGMKKSPRYMAETIVNLILGLINLLKNGAPE